MTESRSHYLRLTRENEAAALAAEAAGSPRVDALPMKITFEFTGDCNLHCFFCNCEFGRNALRRQGIHRFAMDEASFRTLAEAAFPRATLVNPTVIGEPLTFPHFDLLLDYAERYAVKLELITNGMLLHGPRLERLMPLLDRLTISFDGGTRETFERCRTGSRFDRVIENLRAFRELRRERGLRREVKFHFAVTLMRENIEDLPRIVEWAHELDADEVCASHLKVFSPDLKNSSLFAHQALSNACVRKATRKARELAIRFSAPVPFAIEGEEARADVDPVNVREIGLENSTQPAPEAPAPAWAVNRPWCRYAWRQVFISQAGDVAPCCTEGRPVVGNVFRDDWDAIWNGVEYRLLREGLHQQRLRPYCAACPILAEQGMIDYGEASYVFDDLHPDRPRAEEEGRPQPPMAP